MTLLREVTLAAGKTVKLYETGYPSFFVGSNGYVTFGSGDDTARAPLYAHFAHPRISALFRDLNPGFGTPFGGTISWKQLADRVAVTWNNVPEFGDQPNSNNFQIEMFFDGRIRIAVLRVDSTRGIIGFSRGGGIPAGFRESDFSSYRSDPSLTLTIPANANEGAGVLANACTVSINGAQPNTSW